MKKLLLLVLAIAIASPMVGFDFDPKEDDPVILRMPSGGGYCATHNILCPTYTMGELWPVGPTTWHYPCSEGGVLPPYIETVYWENGGDCGYLEITFDGGDFTTVPCFCGMW